jgi:type I restriction enzyme, S subunit
MSLKKINQLFNFEKGVLQSSKCIEGEYDFITAAADWKTHNEYSHDCEALIFAAAASGSLGRTHYVNGKFISSDLCFILTPKEPEKLPVDLKFYHIIFNLYKNEIVAATKAGTSKEAIGLKVFGEYELPYFDISIQYKVKAEFGKAEALKNGLIDEYTYQLTQLENLNQAILQEAVQGKLVKQDTKDEPASELLKRIKAEKAKSGKKEKPFLPIKPEEIPFEIPENWVWCRLGEIADIVRGGSPRPAGDKTYYDGDIPFLKVADLTAGNEVYLYEHTYTIKEAGLYKTRFVEANTLMLTNSGATLGYPKICTFSTTFNDGIAAFLNLSEDFDKVYLFYFLKSLTSWFLKVASRGQGQPNLNTDIIGLTLFPIPPKEEQKRIIVEIDKQLAKTKQLKEHIIANQEATEQLLKALLHQAFEVKEIEKTDPDRTI